MIHCGMVKDVKEKKGPCCTNPNMPWFMTTLNETISEDIELRMCGSEYPGDEDTPLEVIDLYIC